MKSRTSLVLIVMMLAVLSALFPAPVDETALVLRLDSPELVADAR